MECSICLSEISMQQGILTCSHTFCYPCISKWFEHENTCPECRSVQDNKKIEVNLLVPDTLTCLNNLGIKHLFIAKSDKITKAIKCLYCSHYGTLSQCIRTNEKIEDISMCSLCCKELIYDTETKMITGCYELITSRLEKKKKVGDLPSNYKLLDYFYKKSHKDMKESINLLMEKWDDQYMRVEDADRFYDIVSSCLPDKYNKDNRMVLDHLAHQIGPYVIRWKESRFLQKCFKGLYGKIFGYSFDVNQSVNIDLYIKFIYGLRKGVFNHLNWYSNDYTDMQLNQQILKML